MSQNLGGWKELPYFPGKREPREMVSKHRASTLHPTLINLRADPRYDHTIPLARAPHRARERPLHTMSQQATLGGQRCDGIKEEVRVPNATRCTYAVQAEYEVNFLRESMNHASSTWSK